jgi:hypothetical protein
VGFLSRSHLNASRRERDRVRLAIASPLAK